MSDLGDPVPRRALPPRDDPADGSTDPDPTADAADEQQRQPWAASGGGSDDTDTPAPSTPIPPPVVLPPPEGQPASAGRRFSAVEAPSGERPLPRRSALSPAATRTRSPESPAGADPDPGAAPSSAGANDPVASSASLRLVWLVVAGVAVVVIAVVAVLLTRLQPGSPSQPPGVDPVATYLIQPEDLAGLRADTTWTAATTATDVSSGTPQPKCVLAAADIEPEPRDTLVRTFAPSAGQPGGLLHQVDTYASEDDARTAYAARVAQLAACERHTGWTRTGFTLDALADEATGILIELQDVVAEYHTIAVSRTGSRVNIVDATQPDEAVGMDVLATPLAAASARQCVDGGTCPATVAVQAAVPPPVEPAGWLASVDLPRITPGAGEWRATDIPEMNLTGTKCEAVDLVNVSNATASAQRAYLLAEDTAAPAGFGVDEAIYTFATTDEAAAFAGTLAGNTEQCAGRTATAEVARTADLAGAGTGTAWVVTQRVDQSAATARFRSAILVVGNRVVYLMANPGASFDFSDATWHDVATRAGDRVTQLA